MVLVGLSMSMSLLQWAALRLKRWRQVFRYGLTSAEESWRITSLDLLVVFYLMQRRIPSPPSAVFAARTHCWHLFTLGSTSILRSFLPSCSLAEWPSAYSGASACLFPVAKPCTSPCSASPSFVCPFFWSVKIPLAGNRIIWCISHLFQFCVSSREGNSHRQKWIKESKCKTHLNRCVFMQVIWEILSLIPVSAFSVFWQPRVNSSKRPLGRNEHPQTSLVMDTAWLSMVFPFRIKGENLYWVLEEWLREKWRLKRDIITVLQLSEWRVRRV